MRGRSDCLRSEVMTWPAAHYKILGVTAYLQLATMWVKPSSSQAMCPNKAHRRRDAGRRTGAPTHRGGPCLLWESKGLYPAPRYLSLSTCKPACLLGFPRLDNHQSSCHGSKKGREGYQPKRAGRAASPERVCPHKAQRADRARCRAASPPIEPCLSGGIARR